MDALQGMERPFKLHGLKRVDDDRRVCEITIGPVKVGSVWVTGARTTAPNISWPRTTRGYPIIEIEDPDLRSDIEKAILAELRRERSK